MSDHIAFPTLGRSGRLGNQLWQIASTVGIARARRKKPLFPEDWPYRPFFSCPDEWFGPIGPRVPSSDLFATRLDPRVRPYLQSLDLWKHAEAEIRAAFQPSERCMEVLQGELGALASLREPLTAVHIRRGDYVTNPTGTLTSLPLSYYKDALQVLAQEDDLGHVVVFSDDIPWCRTEFPVGALYYEGIPRPKEQEPDYDTAPILDHIDIFLMGACTNHVISNSTYSWWGAWMANEGVTIYPSRWYGDQLATYANFRLMVLPGWREMSVKD